MASYISSVQTNVNPNVSQCLEHSIKSSIICNERASLVISLQCALKFSWLLAINGEIMFIKSGHQVYLFLIIMQGD